jgi:hypothetical protein
LNPCAAPAASFISRPISSKNRLLVWVISLSPVGGKIATTPVEQRMAIWARQFKPA